MGCSKSKVIEPPTNPLQELQYRETQRERRKHLREREQKQIAKLQKKLAKKSKKQRKNCHTQRRSSSLRKRQSLEKPNRHSIGNECDEKMDAVKVEQRIEKKTQAQLDNDLCSFLMNQISLTTQFCGNYESEVSKILDSLLAKENEFNQNLGEHSVLLTNPLDALVSKWVQYKPMHGPNKANVELLQTPAMYVVFENIDVERPSDVNYDSISPLCKVDLEMDFDKSTPCQESHTEMLRDMKWKGYVRLKLRENQSKREDTNRRTNDIYSDSSYSSINSYGTRPPSTTSSGYSSESDYDYAYIMHLNSHHPLSELKMANQTGCQAVDVKVLPESCVSSLGNYLELCQENVLTDDEHESEAENSEAGYGSGDDEYTTDDDGSSSPKYNESAEALKLFRLEHERRKMMLQQRYLNSKQFMCYFGELLRQKLARQMFLPREDLEGSTYRGASIHTKQYEIIPAVHVAHSRQSWPHCAFQFRIRQRPIVTDARTGQQFQWPSREMIKRIETFGYYVIPIGYAPKKQRNPFRELEWRIVFPKAERYLERHLTSTQVKVFLMAKALAKTFIEPRENNKALMFVVDQLRHHLFWECERDYTAWPEEFLGEVLMRFLTTFMARLREKCLRDYFIEERNLFESIPEYSLSTLNSLLADITANPLMHLMVAFRNLHYPENFFPKLNFKQIFQNLAEHDFLRLKMYSKNAQSLVNVLATDVTQNEARASSVNEAPKSLVGKGQRRERTHGKLRKKTQIMRYNIEMQRKQTNELRRNSVESIDIELVITKTTPHSEGFNQGIENLRRTNLLEIFLDHFLVMISKACELQDFQQAELFLMHTKRLNVFYHNYGCDVDATEYAATIKQIETRLYKLKKVAQKNQHTLKGPELPTRVSGNSVALRKKKTTTSAYDDVVNRLSQFVEKRTRTDQTPSHDIEVHCATDTKEVLESTKTITFMDDIVAERNRHRNPIDIPKNYQAASILRTGDKISRNELIEVQVHRANLTTKKEKEDALSNGRELRIDMFKKMILQELNNDKIYNKTRSVEKLEAHGDSSKINFDKIEDCNKSEILKTHGAEKENKNLNMQTESLVEEEPTIENIKSNLANDEEKQSQTNEMKSHKFLHAATSIFNAMPVFKHLAAKSEKFITSETLQQQRVRLQETLKKKTVQLQEMLTPNESAS